MPLRLIDAPENLEKALEALRLALTSWAEGRARSWRSQSALEAAAEGDTFARRDDLYVFLERDGREASLGVALTEKDKELLRLDILRTAPAKRAGRAALASDETGALFLLVAVEELRRQQIREPFRRLGALPMFKRAELGGRDYALLGPMTEPRAIDALQALAGLHPLFDRHIARLGALAEAEEERDENDLYEVSPAVRRMARVHARVMAALHAWLLAQGFAWAPARGAGIEPDLAFVRHDQSGAQRLVFEIRADAEWGDIIRGLGQLVLASPRGEGAVRFFVLPAPRNDLGVALDAFLPAFAELGVSLILYDEEEGALNFRFARAEPTLPPALRALFP